MFTKNPFTGRLSQAPGVQIPMKGVGPVAAEAPVISYTPGTVFPKQQTGPRSTVPDFVLQKMKHFQTPNNIPIHLKGGPLDRVLFGATLVLCAVGVGSCFQFFYEMSFPKKND
ncbi:cytochrome c oxidase subunit 7A2, mitochondrial-like [Portunus trituberculatus]|uniref:cytochrome c oxidase subunit 7A2, mitochondrial-like n=1 Tax=Portunus trituberculatus TaxID=210409 RepID=UPI001E1CE4FE|nr:cytochrome c oxidase subunit 7A2, mitochondrial-like [Portunus trituberculatus]